jgi:putative FmdB family regulatory protein
VPTYELTCADCGHRFEQFLMRIIRDPDKVCPACGSERILMGHGGGFIGKTSDRSSSCGPVGGFG